MTLESHRLKTFRIVWNLQVGECAKRQDQKEGTLCHNIMASLYYWLLSASAFSFYLVQLVLL